MKNVFFCLVLFLSIFMLFACRSSPPAPPPASSPPPASAPTPVPAPPPASASTPESATSPATPAPVAPPPVTAPSSRNTDLVLDGAETYTVVEGDTLSDISRSKYQNGFYYPLIMMAAEDIIQDQDLIEPGMVLTIPRLQANLNDARARASMKKYFLEIAVITDRIRPEDAEGLRKLAGSL
jgi:hypothetical protein